MTTSDTSNSDASTHYDTLIIGAGQSGALAIALGKAGRKTALIERSQPGGTCVNRGCTPSKTLAASARIAHLARRADDFGVRTGPVEIDMPRVRRRAAQLTEQFREEARDHLQSAPNLELLWGEAHFTGPKTVEVQIDGETRSLSAETIVVNTGARPVVPWLEGLGDVAWLDSTSVMQLKSVPSHLLILGGGYIALEFGQMFHRFGARVTVVQQSAHLLDREDDDVSLAVADILREDGLEVLLSAEATRVRKQGDEIELCVCIDGQEERLRGSHLLVATGRTPNTESLSLEAAGIETDDKGTILTDEWLQTNVAGVYAMGDVKGGPAFTHIAYDDGRILREWLLQGEKRSIRERVVPYVVYIDPQLGRVGMTETEARESEGRAGRRVRVAVLPWSETARGLESGEPRGFLKAVVSEDGQILGGAVLGIEGGEVMAALQMAMLGRLPYTALRDGVFAHPSLAESLNILFLRLDA